MTFALDWRSAGLACTADANWRAKIWRGGLLLLLPVVGWPLVLGYRRLFVERVLDGKVPLLPEWNGNYFVALRYGLGAMAVIHAWYAPLYVWLASRTSEWMLWQDLPWLPALVVAAALPIFSTLLVPAWLMWIRFGCDVPVPEFELILMGLAFAAVTFFIPAGFLNVARTRRIVTAFDVPSSLRQIRAQPRRYVEAWLGSGVLSLVAHFALPLAPWAVVWCYLAIIYSFSELPQAQSTATQSTATQSTATQSTAIQSHTWYGYLRGQHWQRYRLQRVGVVESYEFDDGAEPATGPPERRFRALCIGPLRLPLPGS